MFETNNSAKQELKNVPELVYNYLKQRVMSGALVAGQAIKQDEVAKALGVSRSPVREALNLLERENLVVLRPRRGYVVTSLQDNEIEEIFRIRAALEVAGVPFALARRTRADVEAVTNLSKEMDKLVADNPNDLARYYGLDRQFHDTILRRDEQRRLCQIVGNLRDSVEPYVRLEPTFVQTFSTVQREHRAIARAYKLGDEQALISMLQAHIQETFKRVSALFGRRAMGEVGGPRRASGLAS